MKLKRLQEVLLLLLFMAIPSQRQAGAYSLLTREQLIDLAWKGSIVPLPLHHHLNLKAAQLADAANSAWHQKRDSVLLRQPRCADRD